MDDVISSFDSAPVSRTVMCWPQSGTKYVYESDNDTAKGNHEMQCVGYS